MTAIRQGIRELTRTGGAPVTVPVQVVSRTRITSGFDRVVVEGPALDQSAGPRPADAFKLMIPAQGHAHVEPPVPGPDGMPQWPEGTAVPVLRAFTVRYFDAEARRLTVDVAVHDHGAAAQWLGRVNPGEQVVLTGMRREFWVGDGVVHHLLVADASALPAAAAILESLGDEVAVTAIVQAAAEDDHALLPDRPGAAIHRIVGPAGAGPDCALVEAVSRTAPHPGRTQAWIAAEADAVRAVRRLVRTELGVAADDLHASAYWKSGMSSDTRDATLLTVYRAAMADGVDLTDPAAVADLELGESVS